jgi:cystathionine beta-lyase/cystathionine gamma-synthase
MPRLSEHLPALHPDTLAVHAGRESFGDLAVHAPPLDFSTTYPMKELSEGVESIEAFAGGAASAPNSVYARLHNPTVARYEQALAKLEGAEEAVGFASGMAAITACLLATRLSGAAHIIAMRPVYGGSDALLESGLLGLEVSWVRPGGVRAAIRPDTGLVFIETPSNPLLNLLDIRKIVAEAGDIPVVVDSTFATPVLQQPMSLGAAAVVHSGTKFLGGHGDVMAGLVATNSEFAGLLRQVRILTGAVLHPMAAYFLHRGLPTLPLRVRAAQEGAQVLAEKLASHPCVKKVHYPGLPGGDPEGLVGTQMSGPGSVLAFEVSGGLNSAARLMSQLRLITRAVSLGSTDTLIESPSGLTHHIMEADQRAEAGIADGLLRLSVGLENPEDLWADLAGALSVLVSAAPGSPNEPRRVA